MKPQQNDYLKAAAAASNAPTVYYYTPMALLALGIVVFYIVRFPEIISLCSINPTAMLLTVGLAGSIVIVFVTPAKTNGQTIRKFGLLLLILYQLKNEIDEGVVKNDVVLRDLGNHVCIVTGANSGTGFEISQQLYDLNCNVIMGCRSLDKCNDAKTKIEERHNQIVRMNSDKKSSLNPVYIQGKRNGTINVLELDLNDLHSVHKFTKQVRRQQSKVDILVNNAGLLPPSGAKSRQGLESAFGVMHIGHFALTEWLYDLLRKPDPKNTEAARIINVGSAAYMFGGFDASLITDKMATGDFFGEVTDNCPSMGLFNLISCCPAFRCPHTNGYARAKLANILHVHELQRRHDEKASKRVIFNKHRRVVTATVHPGSFQSNILSQTIIGSILNRFNILSYFLRSSYQASYVILHAIMSDNFVPGSYIDAMKESHNLANYNVSQHLKAYPTAASKAFHSTKNSIKRFKYDEYYYNQHKILFNCDPDAQTNSRKECALYSKNDVSRRLWDVSQQVIDDFLARKKLLRKAIITKYPAESKEQVSCKYMI